jgi:hypothetical protein
MKRCGMYGKVLIVIVSVFFIAAGAAGAEPKSTALVYEEAVSQWRSYQDVAEWFKEYFTYDFAKLYSGVRDMQNPADTFKSKKGVCFDGAKLAVDALNRINPNYSARLVFVKNVIGTGYDHWVASFTDKGKLYIIDYAAGGFFQMNGVHGPYESLTDYENFLSSLNLDGFKPQYAECRNWPVLLGSSVPARAPWHFIMDTYGNGYLKSMGVANDSWHGRNGSFLYDETTGHQSLMHVVRRTLNFSGYFDILVKDPNGNDVAMLRFFNNPLYPQNTFIIFYSINTSDGAPVATGLPTRNKWNLVATVYANSSGIFYWKSQSGNVYEGFSKGKVSVPVP